MIITLGVISCTSRSHERATAERKTTTSSSETPVYVIDTNYVIRATTFTYDRKHHVKYWLYENEKPCKACTTYHAEHKTMSSVSNYLMRNHRGHKITHEEPFKFRVP